MATDGVKIIDGDDAHDNYWGIMDLYDSDIELHEIEKQYPLKEVDFNDDFENEIHVTSIGLAYWEIGLMTDERLNLIKSVINRGAGIKEWSEYNEKEGRSRERVLKRYLKKVGKKNEKPRKRKKYRLIKNFHFTENDVLLFKAKDGTYRATICTQIEQYRGHCSYHFATIAYDSSKKPTLDQLKNEAIIGHKIGSGYGKEKTKEMQPGIEKIWAYVQSKENFFLGLAIKAIDHKNLHSIKHNFEKIGTLKIIDGLRRTGSIGYESTFESFQERFENIDDFITMFRYQKYPLPIICE